MTTKNKPCVVFIGAGNLATNLAVSLFNAGCNIQQVYSRSEESAQQLSTIVKSTFTTRIVDVVHDADLYIICVPDKTIHAVADELIVNKGVVVHTSGSTDIQVLSSVKAKGYGVFYPFQSFSKGRIIPFTDIPICINAKGDKTFDLLNTIASLISSKVVRMDSEKLAWLHLTGVFVNNFTNHLLAVSHQITKEKNFDFELLRPLINETVKKAFDGDPVTAQTGPAVRYDQNTINLHIHRLKVYSPELADIYKALTLSIQNLAKKT